MIVNNGFPKNRKLAISTCRRLSVKSYYQCRMNKQKQKGGVEDLYCSLMAWGAPIGDHEKYN